MVVILEDNLIHWLKKNFGSSSLKRVLVLLPSGIVIRNFTRMVCKENLPLDSIETMTLEDLAHRIVEDAVGLKYDIWDSLIQRNKVNVVINSNPTLDCFLNLPLDDRDTLKVIMNEYEEYLRASCVSQLHGNFSIAAQNLKSQFSRDKAIERIEAFKALNLDLQAQVPGAIFQTRYHLLMDAVANLQSSKSILGRYSHVLVAGITVIDSTSFSLIETIDSNMKPNSEVHIFVKKGTLDSLMEKFGLSTSSQAEETSFIPSTLIPSTVHKYECPDRRREVLLVADLIRNKIESGQRCDDMLIVANDCGTYLPFMKDIFPAYGIPFYLQTRRPYSYLYQYRMIQSIIDLVCKIELDEIIHWDELVAPLRLGYCDVSSPMEWPIDGMKLLYIEERLSWKESSSIRLNWKYSDWKNAVSKDGWWNVANDYIQALFDAIDDLVKLSDTHTIIDEIKRIWNSFIEKMTIQTSQWKDPRVDEHARFYLQNKHPTSYEKRLRDDLSRLESYLQDLGGSSISWDIVASSFREVILGGSYGIPEDDQGCVSFVDAGNTWFRSSSTVYLLGMKADEFPRKTSEGVILSEQLRDEVYEIRKSCPALYLRNAQNDYEVELDKFLAVLEAVDEELVITMPYLDERGHSQEWSSFADELPGVLERIQPGDWLPDTTNLSASSPTLPKWRRWQLLAYHENRIPMTTEPALGTKSMGDVASFIDPVIFDMQISPRISRLIDPPSNIIIESTEPWLKNGLFSDLAAPPYRVHELDLHGLCPYRFYFYQFLYNLYGRDFDRDMIPPDTPKLTWRYGPIPRRLEYIYLDDWTEEAVGDAIMNLYPNRVQIATQFQSASGFMNDVKQNAAKWKGFQLSQPFATEFKKTIEEVNMVRNWSWVQGGQQISISDGNDQADLILPSHRLDHLDRPLLLASYVNYSGQFRHLLMSKKDLMTFRPGTATLKEHMLPVLLSYYSSQNDLPIAGAFLIELYDSARDGYFNPAWRKSHRETPRRNRVLKPAEWTRTLRRFTKAVIHQVKSMTPDPDIVYTATPQNCDSCVYRTLCLLGGM